MFSGALLRIWQMRWGRARQTTPAMPCVRRVSRWSGKWRVLGRHFAAPFLVRTMLIPAGRSRVVTGKAVLPTGKRPMRTMVSLWALRPAIVPMVRVTTVAVDSQAMGPVAALARALPLL